MTHDHNGVNHTLYYLLAAIILSYVFLQFMGKTLFPESWAFNFFSYLPAWYKIFWPVAIIGVGLLFHSERALAFLFTCPRRITAWMVLLFAVIVFAGYDSFLYGGGNLRVAQIAQTKQLLLNWYEFGSVALVSALFQFHKLFISEDTTAGVWAWKVFSFVNIIAGIIGGLALVRALTTNPARRALLMATLLSGAGAAILFGFMGIETILFSLSFWFAFVSLRLSQKFSSKRLLLLWLIVGLGAFMHISLLYLLPAALYVSLSAPLKQNQKPIAAVLVAGISIPILLFAVYRIAGDSFYLSQFLLFQEGTPPNTDYGIVDARRIRDLAQLLFLLAPLLLPLAIIDRLKAPSRQMRTVTVGSFFMAIGGLTLLLIVNPVNSVVLDLPRVAAFLVPLSILTTLVFSQDEEVKYRGRPLLPLAATASLMLPLAFLPSLLRIDQAEKPVTEYLKANLVWFRVGSLAFRDAYFYRDDFEKANRWQNELPIVSPDFLTFRGCNDLIAHGQYNDALVELYFLIARLPYWTEPRALAAVTQMKIGKFAAARAQMDTCLLLEPNRKDFLTNDYGYYMTTGKFNEAERLIHDMLKVYPTDAILRSDLMSIYLQKEKFDDANSLANEVIAADSLQPMPYYVKGELAERDGRLEEAAAHFRRFLEIAPDHPDAKVISQRLNRIVIELKQ
ncbi:MAG: tetratricopeptide repeat protein [candidate division Zixibacteria bacterium]|nr:tetratricopeptide repeat protein [candidate division Zixibacteria bacterium]